MVHVLGDVLPITNPKNPEGVIFVFCLGWDAAADEHELEQVGVA